MLGGFLNRLGYQHVATWVDGDAENAMVAHVAETGCPGVEIDYFSDLETYHCAWCGEQL